MSQNLRLKAHDDNMSAKACLCVIRQFLHHSVLFFSFFEVVIFNNIIQYAQNFISKANNILYFSNVASNDILLSKILSHPKFYLIKQKTHLITSKSVAHAITSPDMRNHLLENRFSRITSFQKKQNNKLNRFNDNISGLYKKFHGFLK